MAGPYRPARQHAVRLELHAQDPFSPALSLTRFRWMALRDVNPDDLRGGSRILMQSNEAFSERLLESDGSRNKNALKHGRYTAEAIAQPGRLALCGLIFLRATKSLLHVTGFTRRLARHGPYCNRSTRPSQVG